MFAKWKVNKSWVAREDSKKEVEMRVYEYMACIYGGAGGVRNMDIEKPESWDQQIA